MVNTNGNNHIDIENGSFLDGASYNPTDTMRNLTYNYTSSVTFYSSQVEFKNDSDSKKYIQSTYANATNDPNFTYANTNNFKAEKIYITNVVHNVIPGLTEHNNNKQDSDGNPYIIGELIIEHSPTTGAGNGAKLYSCFFLTKNTTGDVNDIDSLISMYDKQGTNESINIGKKIPKQTQSISYNSKGNQVVIFFNPISISNDSFQIVKDLNYDMSDKFLGTNENIKNETSLFGEKTKTYTYTDTASAGIVTMGASSAAAENDESYLECTPTGESADTIGAYTVPINSEYTNNATNVESQQTIMHFVAFTIIIFSVHTIVPTLYLMLVYKKFAESFEEKEKRGESIRNFDWTLTLFYIFFILFGIFGLPSNSYTEQLPLYGIGFLLLSVMAIQTSKLNNGEFTRIFDYDGNDDIYKHLKHNPLPLNPIVFISFFVETFFYPCINNIALAMILIAFVLFLVLKLLNIIQSWEIAAFSFLLSYGAIGLAHYGLTTTPT